MSGRLGVAAKLTSIDDTSVIKSSKEAAMSRSKQHLPLILEENCLFVCFQRLLARQSWPPKTTGKECPPLTFNYPVTSSFHIKLSLVMPCLLQPSWRQLEPERHQPRQGQIHHGGQSSYIRCDQCHCRHTSKRDPFSLQLFRDKIKFNLNRLASCDQKDGDCCCCRRRHHLLSSSCC